MKTVRELVNEVHGKTAKERIQRFAARWEPELTRGQIHEWYHRGTESLANRVMLNVYRSLKEIER